MQGQNGTADWPILAGPVRSYKLFNYRARVDLQMRAVPQPYAGEICASKGVEHGPVADGSENRSLLAHWVPSRMQGRAGFHALQLSSVS